MYGIIYMINFITMLKCCFDNVDFEIYVILILIWSNIYILQYREILLGRVTWRFTSKDS